MGRECCTKTTCSPPLAINPLASSLAHLSTKKHLLIKAFLGLSLRYIESKLYGHATNISSISLPSQPYPQKATRASKIDSLLKPYDLLHNELLLFEFDHLRQRGCHTHLVVISVWIVQLRRLSFSRPTFLERILQLRNVTERASTASHGEMM